MNEVIERKSNEKSSKKDIVKNVAIAFLAIMLVLTFFSNTIMNYSLPQVATQQISSGPVSPQIRGNGDVSAEDPYNITVKETRKISGVAVKEGDHVEEGDVIYYLEDKESEELSKEKEALDAAELEYETALFSGKVPDDVITKIRGGKVTSYDQFQAELKEATDNYEAALDADNEAKAVVLYLTQKQAYDGAGNAYNAATPSYELAEADADKAGIDPSDKDRLEDINNKINELTKNQKQLETYGGQVNSSYEQKLALAQNEQNKTARALEDAKKVKDELLESIGTEISLSSMQNKIAQHKEKIEKLEADSVGASVKSPVAGTVSSLAKASGESTSADETIAVIQVDGKDMTTSFSVPNNQAQKLKVGDPAQPQNVWQFGEDFKATLTSIKNDKTDPAGKKVLTFKIESSEVQPGQSLALTIGERSKDYDMIVPKSAIKSDSNGKFVLTVTSKSSPLGNRYIATRVDVNVEAEDDKNAAITGSLEGSEYVITTSTKPVKAGEQIRLADE
ncbi:HlyD family efflux transporter periplasmic adaptor subunit [Butyrivibrio sp. X503]|uniref:HlyD family efflux transporter periplasmic adaptor subunit n=1 Tax=Butyrivibrio sp. X503 TaxID=2364878 RepID=UPI000EA962A2|nr:HlyD family efflux transporter periplasmic adaptor subunit [Butyrivibrio sp. X503]RKM57052.1 HlyD family efflux transporter periplasmic adaptor subunit [Butyrivibrio sp. X503]